MTISNTSNFQFCEYVDKSKLQTLIDSGILKDTWSEEDKKKKHKRYVINTFKGEKEQFENYLLNLNDNSTVITYTKDRRQGRHQVKNCLSSMKRIYRNYLVNEDYYDFDMVNSGPSILLHLCNKHNSKNSKGARTYVNKREEWFEIIRSELKCDDKKAKKLMTSLTFGAQLTFKDEKLNGYKTSLPFIQTELKETHSYDFIETEKNGLSWMAHLIQTIEDDIVIGLLNHIILNFPLLVRNIYGELPLATYEQDGFKLLKCNVDEFGGPDAVVGVIQEWLQENNYNEIKFISKNMDEKVHLDTIQKINQGPTGPEEEEMVFVKPTGSKTTINSPITTTNIFSPIIITPTIEENVDIKITIDDLEKGERFIADLIFPIFENQIKYYEISVDNKCIKYWYSLNKRNLWVQSIEPPRKKIITKLQELIEIEKNEVWELYKKETDEAQKKRLGKLEEVLGKYYSNVGKSSFSNTLCSHYLCNNLQDNSFPKKINNTIGKLVFNDGILDLKTGIFKAGFEPKDYITSDALLSHNYLELRPNQTKMNYLKDEFKKICNNSDTDFEYTFSVIGYSFTGDAELEKSIYYLVDGTEDKRGDNGKTFVFCICSEIFPELVKLSDPEMLEDKYTKAYKHIATWKNKRIVYFDEGTKKKLNSKLVKKIGDGKFISNEIMFGCVEEIKVYFKMFVCSNHMPKIGNDEEAVFNRYVQLEFGSHFDRTGERVKEDPSKLEFIANPRLSQKIVSEYKDEFITMIINYAKKYYQTGLPPIPTKFIEATKQTRISNNEFSKWFFETYEAGTNADEAGTNADEAGIKTDTIGLDNLIGNYATQISREDVIKELKKIRITFNKDLTGFGTKMNDKGKKVYIKGGIVGWKLKQKEEEEEVK